MFLVVTLNVNERAVVFGANQSLIGIVTPGASTALTAERLGAIVLNAGFVHRIGPSRMGVRLARQLASDGLLTVRFDLSGIGDSAPRRDGRTFHDGAVRDTREVMNDLQSSEGIDRFVLLGLCSGADISFRTVLQDQRVTGAVLINPQGFDLSNEWTTHVRRRSRLRHYWRRAVFSPDSWRRALTGRIDYRGLLDALRMYGGSFGHRPDHVADVSNRLSAEFQSLRERGTELLVCCTEGDESTGNLEAISGAAFGQLRGEHLQLEMLAANDHSLTLSSTQKQFLRIVRGWVSKVTRAPCLGGPEHYAIG